MTYVETLRAALTEIAQHQVLAPEHGKGQVCDWHCTARLVAIAADALTRADGSLSALNHETRTAMSMDERRPGAPDGAAILEPVSVSGAGCHWCHSRATGWRHFYVTRLGMVWYLACDEHRGVGASSPTTPQQATDERTQASAGGETP